MKPTVSTDDEPEDGARQQVELADLQAEPYLPLRWSSCCGLLPSGATNAITM
jgi:hypothetical protein